VTSDIIKAGVTQIKDNMSNSDYNTRAAAAEMCLGTQLTAPPKPSPPPKHCPIIPPVRDTLPPGGTMKRGDSLTSLNGKYTANLQGDGNFCIRGVTSWCLNSVYKDYYNVESITMQGDGNFCTNTGPTGNFFFCQYGYGKQAGWAKQVCGQGGGNYAIIQNDGNFVIYNKDDQALWASGTNSPPNATSCHGWDCSIEGQYCPKTAPGGSKTAGSSLSGFCCKNKKWTAGSC